MELITLLHTGPYPMLAVLQWRVARGLLVYRPQLVLLRFLLVPTGRPELERYLRVRDHRHSRLLGGAKTPEKLV